MRSEKHHKKRKTRWTIFFLTFLLLIGATVGYSYYQFKQGVNQSLKKVKKENKKKVVYTFEGKKDQYGDTNILLLGSDARGNERSRSDTIMIVHYNENKKTFKL
jgi:anionic cell wall polymer biosynthesis LytR-Cps2A-Psr (LCP) family protein